MSPIDLKAANAALRLGNLMPPVGSVVQRYEEVIGSVVYGGVPLEVVGHTDTSVVVASRGANVLIRCDRIEVLFLPDDCPPIEEWPRAEFMRGVE